MNPTRINALTGIRAIAAVMVFVYHNRKYWRTYLPDWLNQFYNELHTGVSVFFVLSGFLIAYTYKDKPLQSGRNFFEYLSVRLVRIFPVYLLILFAKFFIEGFPPTKEVLLTTFLLHGFSDRYNLNGLPQAWSLTVELSFYTIAPLLFYLNKKNSWRAIVFLCLFLGTTIAIGYGWHSFTGNKDRFFYPLFFIFNTSFAGRCFEFFCGMMLAKWILQQEQIQHKGKMKTWLGLLAMIAVIYVLGLFEPSVYKHGTDHPAGLAIRNLVFPAAVSIFLYGLITERTIIQKFLATRVMVLLGNASFVFYLIHIGFVNLTIRSWRYFWDRNFILLWIVSVLIYLLVEKPVYNLMKKIIKRQKKMPGETFAKNASAKISPGNQIN